MIGAALLAAASLAVAPAASSEAPNVVLVMTDDQTVESMRVMDGVQRSLADQGTTFERSFVTNPLCCPSRASVFTGQYAHNHGVQGNRPPEGGYRRLRKREWLPVWLDRAGYQTVHIGKFLNGYGTGATATEVPPGWDEWYTSIDPSTYSFRNYTLNENGVLHTYPTYSTDDYTARAVSVVERMSETATPFFLSVAYLAPHSGRPGDPDDLPGIPTPSPAARHVDRFKGARAPAGPAYNEADVSDKPSFVRASAPIGPGLAAAIDENYSQELESLLAVDEGVVAIVNALAAEGELDNTLIVYTSDNGFFHGEHRFPNGKVAVYEPSIRVPLIMRGPGVPAGERRRQLVTNADLAPTILDAAGAVAAGRLEDGRSLFPLLDDPGREWGRDLLIEGSVGFNQPAYDALRTYRYTYVEHANGERELYDLELDPHQLQSVHADPGYAVIQAELAGRLLGLKNCAGRSCRERPAVRLTLQGCRARVSGLGIEEVRFRSAGRARDVRGPFRARVSGARLRTRVRTVDGRVVTLDRRLPLDCRA